MTAAGPRPAPRSIVWVRLDRFGEVLLNLPAVGALRRAYPQARITLLVQPMLRELVAAAPGVDEVLSYAPAAGDPWWREAWRVTRLLRGRRFELAVVAHPKKSLHVAAALAGIPRRLGYNRKWGWLLTDRVPDRKASGELHEVEYNVRLVEALGIAVGPVTFTLPIAAEAAGRTDRLLREEGLSPHERLIGVHPWASTPRKQWPVDQYQRCLERCMQEAGAAPLILGGTEEGEASRRLCQRLGGRTVCLAGRLSLMELAAVLQRCRVLLTNDSGPMHLASAVGTPVVALFGGSQAATAPTRWGPWGNGHTVISHPDLAAITVDEVYQALLRYLPS